VHVPTRVALRVVPEMEQPAVPMVVTTKLTAPVPEPPLESSTRFLPYVPPVVKSESVV